LIFDDGQWKRNAFSIVHYQPSIISYPLSIIHYSLGGLLPRQCQSGAVAIGNFDGVHLGHQALLAETVRQAKLCAGPALAVTFAPHPLQLLRPESFQTELTSVSDRVELLHRHGADHVVVLETTWDLLRLSARDFFEQIIGDRLRARAIVEGLNFAFGRNREGTVATLQLLGQEKNVAVVLVPPLALDQKPVSSSRVRNELLAGDVVMARRLLGRPFRLTGSVASGQKRGQTLGFPTANLEEVATLIPRDGVYAGRVCYADKTWPAAVNVGPNPTFGEQTRKIEAHLIGFKGDLYGQTLAIDFIEKLRDTRAFAGVQELKQQLQDDLERTSRIVQ
jgi:riboflavin kinase / FMN adenylyltransferase